MKKRIWILPIVVLLVIFFVGTCFAAWLLIPARTNYGATWETYLKEPRNSVDVLYFGSSLVYCNVVPSVIWEENGIASYVMAGPEQTIPITYSYIKETCRTQNPKAIVIEVTGMFYSQYCSFTKANISYMPYTLNRVAATLNAAEPELKAGLLLPILDYHTLWTSVGKTALLTKFNPGTDIFAGYTYLEKIEVQNEIKVRGYKADTENYARNVEYLNKIYRYCQRNDIELVLMITPTMGRVAEPALTQLKNDIAQLPNVHFVDFNDTIADLELDNDTDWYDFIHFNCRGAEKFSRQLANYLSEELGLGATEGVDESLWQARVDEFAARLSKVKAADTESEGK